MEGIGVWLERDGPLRLARKARERIEGGWKTPLCLPFRAREGDGCGWKETAPSVSRFERGREMGSVGKRWPPPSHVSSEGGGLEGSRPPPSRISSEGGDGGLEGKSVSRFGRGREMVTDWKEDGPLHLTFRARVGDGDGLEGRWPPPSRFLRSKSEGGDGGLEGRSVSRFGRGKGMVTGWKEDGPPLSRFCLGFRGREGWGLFEIYFRHKGATPSLSRRNNL